MKSRTKKPVRLAVIGTGGMANWHAENFRKNPACQIVAACDVDAARVKAFAEKHSIPQSFASAEDMLKGAEFDAVTIVTPDAFHAPVSLLCLKAGKHVLCEKPLALNYGDAKKMVQAAKKAGVVNMVNFSYRDWPCIQAAAKAVATGEIGEVRHVEASYLQAWLASSVWGDWRKNPAWLWRLSSSHGSKGALGDVGVHIVDYTTFPCGPIKEVYCRMRAFHKAPGDRIGEYKFDANDSAVLNVEFANGALGTIHTSRWVGGHANRLALKIAGTKGTIAMDSEVSTTAFKICNGKKLNKGEWREVACKAVPTNYQRFISAIQSGTPGEADFARGAEVQKVLDACFESEKSKRPVKL
ncbi:MAG: Gfo/Idh/MocA family oxidoreductase [Verrucomicrobiota bacterium]